MENCCEHIQMGGGGEGGEGEGERERGELRREGVEAL